MPGGLIRKGIFNRRAASAISGVESWAKARDNDSAVMLRSCALWRGLQKEQTFWTSGFEDSSPVADSCQMIEWTYEAVDHTGSRLLRNRELGVRKSRRRQ